nr:NADH dehydrogenase subunit 3 [Pseudotrapelus sinaitus]
MHLTTAMIASRTIPTALITLSQWAPTAKPDSEKFLPYECGFSPLENTRLPFSLQFFLIAIFFLLFDLEIALLLPIPWSLNTTAMVWMFTLITLLTLGLLYEWSQGALD